MKTIAINRRASFDYSLRSHVEAGVVLSGQEVRSVKTGHASLKGAFVTTKASELYLTNANIPWYVHAGEPKNYDPTRARKLLLSRKEIDSLIGKSKVEGLALVPTRLYIKKGRIKVEVAVAEGKKQYDKRATISDRETKRKIARAFRARS